MLVQVLDEVAWSTGIVFLPSLFHRDSSVSCFCVMVKQIKICCFGGEISQRNVTDHNLTKAI